MHRGGKIYISPPCALSLGLLALAFGSLLDMLLGATFEGQRCVGLEKKDEKVFGFLCLEDDSFGYLADYLEGKDPKYF